MIKAKSNQRITWGRGRFLGRIFASLFLVMFQFAPAFEYSQESIFKNLVAAWKEYEKYPSSENAQVLIKVLPKEYSKESLEIYEKLLLTEAFRKIEINAFSGDRNAVRALFRLLNVSDGAAGEFLSIELGLLIRINPKLFLEELKYNRNIVVRLDSLVGDRAVYG